MSNYTKLNYKNYLTTINALPGSQLFRHLYVKDETGREFDATNDGDLSCALTVSSILCLFGWIDKTHATVKSTIESMFGCGWRATGTPRPGDIVHYPAKGTHNEHVGFFMGADEVISNISAQHVPAEHQLQMSDGRLPVEYYTRDYGDVEDEAKTMKSSSNVSREIHKKLSKKYFDLILSGQKTFEFRVADFDCESGDILVLDEYEYVTDDDNLDRKLTGRSIRKVVGYVGKTKDFTWLKRPDVKKDAEKYGYQIMSLL